MPKLFVPHTFRAGDAIDPRQVNENALAIHSHFLRMMEDRYNYFSVVLPFGIIAATETNEFTLPIKIPFDAEIVSAEMSMYCTTGGGSDTAVTVTCDLDNWNDLSATLDVSDTTTRQSDFSAQSVTIPANTLVTFTTSTPGASNAMLMYVVLHCRYDCIAGYESDAGVTIAAPTLPQVTDDESYATTEWSTWHTAMDTQIDRLSSALTHRKRFEILTTGKDLALSITSSTARGHIGLPGRDNDYCCGFTAFHMSDATFTVTTGLYDNNLSRNVVTPTGKAGDGLGTWTENSIAIANPDVDSGSQASVDLELQISTSGSGSNYRSHAIISWKESA